MKKVISVILIIATVFSFSSCGKKEILRVASSDDVAPYGYLENNELKGIDIEVGKALADKLGMSYEVTAVPFDSVVAEVESGEYDIGIAALVSTERMQKKVNTTESYTTNNQYIITNKSSLITSVISIFSTSGTRVGAIANTSGYSYVKWDVEDAGYGTVQSYDTSEELIAALKNGDCDCIVVDEIIAAKCAEDPELTKIDKAYSSEEYVIVVNKNKPELFNLISEALLAMKEEGIIQKIVEQFSK